MKRYTFPQPAPSEITSKSDFLNRREFMKVTGAASLATLGAGLGGGLISSPASAQETLKFSKGSPFSIEDEPNPIEDIKTYNNFYEFGTGKDDPAKNAGALTTNPWSIKIDGLTNKPSELSIEDLMSKFDMEERIYRLRCVEAWSMVIPWVGIPLADVIKAYEPQGSAKYVSFETLVRPEEMNGQNSLFGGLDWPYVEGLRMDEAMHPLTMLAVGVYGDLMPNQNGAPVRLVVPWKYGFKSIKSVVRMSFTEEQPPTTWNIQGPNEYGFYSNVNPSVDHPRWSQKSERIIGSGLFAKKRDTDMFNGYEEQVASLYDGMDLAKNF